ncbi:MAG: hypothetical protein JWR04_1839 [Rhodoglobus sp.]|nr:hypothetical protein [Rhodoglobus sp.]
MTDAARAAIGEILSLTRLLSLATVTPSGLAHANTAFFAYQPDFRLVILSPLTTEHARNLAVNPTAAATVFDSRQTRELRRGVQVFGRMTALDGAHGSDGDAALRCFGARFPEVAAGAPSYEHVLRNVDWRLFELVPARVKVFDEALLQKDDYVEVALRPV